MKRKLDDEVYFRVIPTEKQLRNARISGMTGYDINLPEAISKDQIAIVTDSSNKVLTALDFAKFVFEKAKNIDIFREMHPAFFEMFEVEEEQNLQQEESDFER